MNTDDRLLQILENSACLSKGQLTGYIKHNLYPEELRAVELHLSSCALCHDALEGLELQQDADQLIASMAPPVLPALPGKEKPKEKKEPPPVKVETAAHTMRNAATPAQDQHPKSSSKTTALPVRNKWLKPLGIAAAILLAFGTLFWHFEFNRDNSKREIALHTEPSPAIAPEQQQASDKVAPNTIPVKDSIAGIMAKKHTDSVVLAKREEQKRKTRKDSLVLALASKKGDSDNAVTESSALASLKSTADEAENAPVAAKKATAPAMVAKGKEETKKEATDYELGMQKYKEKNYASALLYFKSAESDKSDPKHLEAVFYSGICNRNLSKDRKARKLFERVVEAGGPLKKSAQKQLDAMKNND